MRAIIFRKAHAIDMRCFRIMLFTRFTLGQPYMRHFRIGKRSPGRNAEIGLGRERPEKERVAHDYRISSTTIREYSNPQGA